MHEIGDTVLIRSDLMIDYEYGDYMFHSNMEFFKGTEVTIYHVYNDNTYLIDEDQSYVWTNEMFEEVNKDSDIIIISDIRQNSFIRKLNEKIEEGYHPSKLLIGFPSDKFSIALEKNKGL